MTEKSHEFKIILTSAKAENGTDIARKLIENRLAACVQIAPLHSFYEWDGKVCEDDEVLLIIKTRASLFADVQNLILTKHVYEIPEIISIPIENGFTPYLNWISQNTKAPE